LSQIKETRPEAPKVNLERLGTRRKTLMLRLAAVLYILVASAVGGAAVIAVLSLDMREGWQIAAAFVAGLVISIPIAAVLGKKIYNALQGPKPV
jgi:membrane protease YdiL (CAAX protease family)